MTRAKCFAKIETPEGTYEMTKAEVDELRMLLATRKQLGVKPQARPPVHESRYNRLCEFLTDHVGDDGYLGALTGQTGGEV